MYLNAIQRPSAYSKNKFSLTLTWNVFKLCGVMSGIIVDISLDLT